MEHWRNLLATLGLIGVATVQAAGAGKVGSEPVRTTNGLVSGTAGKVDGVVAFRGIPFGAPPVGDLRWKPPQPVASWDGVRAGDKFGPVCMQPRQPQRTPNNRAVDLPDSPAMSEDCLYLNVWTAAASPNAKLPVMVWIYGGAYTEGAGSTPYNHGDTFASKGVVYVSCNYRLGSLGFLAHPELTKESPHGASGNYALADTLAALQWVKQNIAAFGGNPNNVTIFGESAGAAISSALVGVPQAKGLFQRSISESGTWMGLNLAPMRSRESAEQQTVKTAEQIGATSLAALRALPADDAANKLPKQGMIIDGWIVPEDLSRTFAAGRQNRVDILVGSNRDEGSFAAGFGPPMTMQRWKDSAAQRWADAAELGTKAYPVASDADAVARNNTLFTDNLEWITRLYAEQQRAVSQHVYMFHFVHEPPYAADAHNLGVCHTCELPYVFNNLGTLRLYPDSSSPELAVASAKDAKVGEITQAYWINFAKTGDPNGKGLPKWPAFKDVATGPVLHLSEKPVPGDSLGPDRVKLYRALYERQMAAH
jgi:para-nitrobenzyl esterase